MGVVDELPARGPLAVTVIDALVRNGRKHWAWRCVDGVLVLVVVGLTFTMVPEDGDDKATFEAKMLAFARGLARLGYPLAGDDSLSIEQRAGGRPWANFEVRTPQYWLARVVG